MYIINRLKELKNDFAHDHFWGGGNAGKALLAESIEIAGKDVRMGLEALASAIEKQNPVINNYITTQPNAETPTPITNEDN